MLKYGNERFVKTKRRGEENRASFDVFNIKKQFWKIDAQLEAE
jgi:hypothetical protein